MLAFLSRVDPNVSVPITNLGFLRALSILANGFSFVNSPPSQPQKTSVYRQKSVWNHQKLTTFGYHMPTEAVLGADADGTISHRVGSV